MTGRVAPLPCPHHSLEFAARSQELSSLSLLPAGAAAASVMAAVGAASGAACSVGSGSVEAVGSSAGSLPPAVESLWSGHWSVFGSADGALATGIGVGAGAGDSRMSSRVTSSTASGAISASLRSLGAVSASPRSLGPTGVSASARSLIIPLISLARPGLSTSPQPRSPRQGSRCASQVLVAGGCAAGVAAQSEFAAEAVGGGGGGGAAAMPAEALPGMVEAGPCAAVALPVAPPPEAAKQVTWSDQHGYALADVWYAERLHYSYIDEEEVWCLEDGCCGAGEEEGRGGCTTQ